MKKHTQKYVAVGLLLAAVIVIAVVRNHHVRQQLESLPDDSVVGNGTPVLLELGASWCPPCRRMEPVLIELSSGQDAFLVAQIDVDAANEKLRQYGVEAIPTLLFFNGAGDELYRHVGYFSKASILAKWEALGVNVPESGKH